MTAAPDLKQQHCRWWNWLRFGQLRCPHGHHLKTPVEIDEAASGSIRCGHWIAAEHRECGDWVWVTRIGGSGHIVVAITLEDRRELRKLGSITEKIDYLGIFNQLKQTPAV